MSDPRDQSFPSVAPPPPAAPRPLPPAAWFPDPSGRHEHRYWNGADWTEHVADRGAAGVDPIDGSAPQVNAVQPSAVQPSAAWATAGVAPPPSVLVESTGSSAGWTREAPPVGPAAGRVRSLTGLATGLTVVLWAGAGVAAIGVIAYADRVSVVNDLLDARTFGDFAGLQQRADDADAFVGIVAVLLLLLLLATFVLLVIWMWRVAKNAELLGRTEPRFGPGWTIGAWFIPLANFVIPLLVTQDLWRGSDPESPRGNPTWRSHPGSALVGWWWAAWVVSLLLQIGGNDDGTAVTDSGLRSLRTQDLIAAAGMAATVAAAVLLGLVVRRITARQAALLGATPPPA